MLLTVLTARYVFDASQTRYHVTVSKLIAALLTSGPGSAERQARRLEQEGVEVTRGSLGEFCIDFRTYGWFPSALPGEELSDSEDDGEAEG